MLTTITTESLRWSDPDYDATAGTLRIEAAKQADTTPHLFFVDLTASTNDGREVVLERIEGGKLLSILLNAQQGAQRDKPKAAYATVRFEWKDTSDA